MTDDRYGPKAQMLAKEFNVINDFLQLKLRLIDGARRGCEATVVHEHELEAVS